MENFRPHAKYAPPINIAKTMARPLNCKVGSKKFMIFCTFKKNCSTNYLDIVVD